jgi:hypothetical protein
MLAVANDAPSVFPLGDTIVTFTAVDSSGNSASATTVVTVVDAATLINRLIQDVAAVVAAADLPVGNANALTSTLDAALSSLAAGNDSVAVNQMAAFINQVQAMMNGNNPRLTQAEGQALITAGNAVVAQIQGGG